VQGDEMHKQFTQYLGKQREAGTVSIQMEFQVQVLTTGFWPAQRLRELVIPSEMVTCIQSFTDWYNEKHNHRLLKW
jgi:cullin 1